MAASRVQMASAPDTGTAAITIGSGQGWATPTAGNLIVGWYNGEFTVTTPTGFTAGPSVVDGNGVYIWWKIAAGTESSVTFTQSGTTEGEAGLIEYSGVAAAPTDVQNASTVSASNGTSTTAVSVTATGASGDLFVAVAGLHGGTTTTSPAWTNGFTNIATVTSGASGSTYCGALIGESQNTSAATVSTAASWTGSVLDRQELLIAFKLAAGAAEQIPTLVMARSA